MLKISSINFGGTKMKFRRDWFERQGWLITVRNLHQRLPD